MESLGNSPVRQSRLGVCPVPVMQRRLGSVLSLLIGVREEAHAVHLCEHVTFLSVAIKDKMTVLAS